MFNASSTEFPFVAELPKREKSRLGKLWDELSVMSEAVDKHGMLLTPVFVSKLLDVSRQRVWELTEAGKLERVEIGGQGFITENSVVAWAKEEHKSGRPCNVPKTMRESWRRAKQIVVKK